jgi:hypothetical protein
MINTKQLVIEAISRAEAGSVTAARRLVGEIAKYIEADKPLPEPLKGYALTALTAGSGRAGSLDKGFHLAHRPGRSKATLRHKQMAIAVDVYRLRKAGVKAGDAYEQVARTQHKDVDRVKDIYLAHRAQIKALEEAGSLAGWIAERQYL